MVVEHFDLKALMHMAKSRECLKRYPLTFWGHFAVGAAVATFLVGLATGVVYYNTPLLQPTLQLASDVVPAGGRLGFVQSASPVRVCPQENSRAIWRWTDGSKKTAEIYLLSDANAAPRVWDGPSIVYVMIPADIPPGTYYYMRETASWCSWINYLLFRPSVERTPPVKFEVVSRQLTP